AGIRLAGVPRFVIVQLLGAACATALFRWLVPTLPAVADEVLVPHPSQRRGRSRAMKKVIFACVHNAGRSQMAAAFFNHLVAASKAKAFSAGTHPADRVHPEVVQIMKEVGIDLSIAKPQRLTEELAKDADLLITMGCGD